MPGLKKEDDRIYDSVKDPYRAGMDWLHSGTIPPTPLGRLNKLDPNKREVILATREEVIEHNARVFERREAALSAIPQESSRARILRGALRASVALLSPKV